MSFPSITIARRLFLIPCISKYHFPGQDDYVSVHLQIYEHALILAGQSASVVI